MTTAYLNRIGTAVPSYDVHGTFVDFAATLLPSDRHRALFTRMAERGGIEHRWSPLRPRGTPIGFDAPRDPVEAETFYVRGDFPTTATRMGVYNRTAPDLALSAVGALDLEGREREITHLVVVSCTGFSAPGLDIELVARLGLDTSVERTIVGFMGCYAGINGLRLARHIVRSEPSARVLVVCLELCSLHLQESDDLEKILSFLIFGDGCAAALVSADRKGLSLDRFRTLLATDEPGLITWNIGDQGFDMVLSGKVPAAVGRTLARAAPNSSAMAAPTTSTSGRCTREAGPSSTRSRPPSPSLKTGSPPPAACSRATATCRRRPCSSCWPRSSTARPRPANGASRSPSDPA